MKTNDTPPIKGGPNAPLSELARRWTNERDPQSRWSSVGRGDVSSWSRGTTGPIRPEVRSGPRNAFKPIRSIGRIQSFTEAVMALKAKEMPKETIVMPPKETRRKEVGEGEAFGSTLKIQKDFWKRLGFNAKGVKS